MKAIQIVLLLALAGTGGAVLAHGDEQSGKKAGAKQVQKVNKEQKDWGIAGEARAAKRVIRVSMADTMRFSPEKVEVKQGETVKFVLKNDGKTMHEMVIGSKKVLDEHAALMMKYPNMEHDEPYMTHVAPGKTGEIIWTFNRPGDFDFACLIAGHYQAGMRGKIVVSAAK